jgi:hypothetical protein
MTVYDDIDKTGELLSTPEIGEVQRTNYSRCQLQTFHAAADYL